MTNNIFVLCTGRSGSATFSKACRHLTNFSVGHESRAKIIGPGRIDYPERHIEVDNRLTWFLGRLEERYGDDAYYVHLSRDRDAVAASFNRRWHMRGSIMRGYCDHICMAPVKDPLAACYDYVDTVSKNISAFLKSKTKVITVELNSAEQDFGVFLERINGEGDLRAAKAEWRVHHNSSR